MSKIIGVTVGTPISPKAVERKLNPVKTVNGIEPDENGNVSVADGGPGVYVGSGEMPEGYNVQIDPDGETPAFVLKVNGQTPDDSGNVEIPTGVSELQPLTFTGAVEVTYDGKTPVSIDIPTGNSGGVDHTEAEKIIEYTVSADSASTTKFVFTASDYPKLAQYNHLRGIYKTPTNVSWPWTQIFVNNTVIAKQSGSSTSMALFDILRHGEIFDGAISAYTNPSNYNAWTKDNQAFRSSIGSLLPKKLGVLTSIAVGSYQAFLSEGSTIEIWGWNE